ncbi:MAG: BlaI/MecI/CopY family transcriptional regulator [Actinomycetota bacterium]
MAKSVSMGKLQLQIMQILWQNGEASAREITDALSQAEPVMHSTVQTILRKLEAKGAVAHRREGRTFIFGPLCERSAATETATRDLLDRVFHGSIYGLVSHLLKHETISQDELRRLRQLIDEEGK